MKHGLWRDQRGTLYEIPIGIMALFLVAAIAIPAVTKHGWKGLLPLVGLLVLGVLGIAAFAGAVWVYDRFIKPSRTLSTVLEYAFGIILRMLAGGFFVAIFDGFFLQVYPELSVGLVMAVEGAILFSLSAWHTWHRRRLEKRLPEDVLK